jgi:hypothetical protein
MISPGQVGHRSDHVQKAMAAKGIVCPCVWIKSWFPQRKKFQPVASPRLACSDIWCPSHVGGAVGILKRKPGRPDLARLRGFGRAPVVVIKEEEPIGAAGCGQLQRQIPFQPETHAAGGGVGRHCDVSDAGGGAIACAAAAKPVRVVGWASAGAMGAGIGASSIRALVSPARAVCGCTQPLQGAAKVRPAGGGRQIVENQQLKPHVARKPLRAGLRHCALEQLAAFRPLARGCGDHDQQDLDAVALRWLPTSSAMFFVGSVHSNGFHMN